MFRIKTEQSVLNVLVFSSSLPDLGGIYGRLVLRLRAQVPLVNLIYLQLRALAEVIQANLK